MEHRGVEGLTSCPRIPVDVWRCDGCGDVIRVRVGCTYVDSILERRHAEWRESIEKPRW